MANPTAGHSPLWEPVATYLIVLKAIREKIKKETGDLVDIVLEQDLEERKIEVPADLQFELDKHTNASEFSVS